MTATIHLGFEVGTGDPEAEARFRDVQLAYDVLSDPERRARYDATGDTAAPRAAEPHADLMDVLAPVLTTILRELINQKQDLATTDVIAYMKTAVTRQVVSLTEQKRETERLVTTLTDAAGRFTVDAGEENLLAAATRCHLALAEAQAKGIGADLDRFERAAAYLAKCRFTHAEAKAMSLVFRGSMAYWAGPSTSSSATRY